ncbi:MAG TPA: hypothetical protein DD733_00680 [Clostridiales bacterium]|nr:hypothetical protein [Eubacteriales bacterium]HBR30575.1 hypothetical protein [Clostridiales bacterium]
MKITKNLITPESIKKQRWEIVNEMSKNRKRGIILDVAEVEGSYALKDTESLYNGLSIGEKLDICDSRESPDNIMLTVKALNGKTVGFLPASISLLLRLLLEKKCSIYCYTEYKNYTNKLLTVCISIYVQRY